MMNLHTEDRILSYTASDIFPVKLLQNRNIIDKKGHIKPYHLQLIPTNKCNLNCSYCSCSERDKSLSLPWSEVQEMLYMFAALGTKSITITGGGEPLLYPQINDLIKLAYLLDIETGLVSNGIAIEKLESNPISWVRISFSDDRILNEEFFKALTYGVEANPRIDWSFSYVVTRKPQYGNIKKIIQFAGELGFCHVRLVSDLLDVENVPTMDEIRSHLQGISGEHLVIYQGRKDHTKGQKRCLISLLKPTVAANGGVYPCCGAQYALKQVDRDFRGKMKMGHWQDFINIKNEQRYFDGSVCAKCYYRSYNTVLDMLTKKVKHLEHV